MANPSVGAARGASDQNGTHRIPPWWQPGTDYAWREYERDLENWVSLTDLDAAQHGPAVFQRLGGMAKVLARQGGPSKERENLKSRVRKIRKTVPKTAFFS